MTGKEKEKIDFGINTEEMAKAGVHFGHKSSKLHPKMGPYLYGVRNGIHIIDLKETKEKLEKALKFIENLISENKALLVVGTKIQIKDLVKNFAKECGLLYVSERWLGGTFTNFEVIKKRINHFKELEDKRAKGELEKYTKRERAKIDLELKNFERKFGGIKDMEDLPDAILILSMEKDNLVVKEAIKKNIKIIAISDSNTDPTLADYPIPANDDAVSSVKYILEKVKDVILKARQEVSKKNL
ncbi:MAG: 30S ribosomal protein S2 [Candidatus Nealsonbacteria bacterium]|nr:MAG: 30S ribosomal protein S2 [Candidatus Nealsonbacteria bacterium]